MPSKCWRMLPASVLPISIPRTWCVTHWFNALSKLMTLLKSRGNRTKRITMSYRVDIEIASHSTQLPAADDIETWIAAALDGALEACGSEREISVYIVDEEESQALNQQYRQQNKSTNVL